ncbi:MAG: CHRD domain-containing protein [Saprospiraceae bacterium]|nr:CHRD domain-containing protein [Saprospiraceae bacterium]
MKKAIYTFLFFCLLSAGAKAQLPHLIFHAELVGSEQIPAVTTNATGLITLMYSPDRTKVNVSGLFVGLEGDITGITLHIGKTGEVGDAIVDLMPVVHGRRLNGEVSVPASLLQNLLPDRAYASLSTTAHPDGELRGQFICETDLDYKGILTGSEVVPVTPSTAFGFGGLHFPTGSQDLVYAFLVDGLSSPITSASLYYGNPGENGTLVYSFPSFFLNFIQGVVHMADLPADFLREAREGKYYVMVNTANYPDGEIRGQIGFLGYFTSFAPVNAAQMVPSAPSPGFGFSHNQLNQTLDSLTTTVYISTITPTSVDIRMAPPGMNGPVIETLNPTGTPGVYQKKYPLDADRMSAFVEGKLYVLVPTAARPNGEIRGQMKNSLRKGYAYDLCGDQVVPPVNTDGIGVAMSSVDQANCYLNYKIIYDRMDSDVVDAFVCQANPMQNGNAIYALPTYKPLIPGSQEIETNHGVAIEIGETYVILRTAEHPTGEIRGQIRRGFTCPELSAVVQVDQITDINVSPVPFQDVLTLAMNSKRRFTGKIIMHDLLGAPTLVHQVEIQEGVQTISIPVSSVPAGMYSLSLEIPDQGKSMLLKKLTKG